MLIKFENKSSRVKGLAFHPKRPWVLASLHSGVVQLWDFRMETLIDVFQDHDGPVRGVDFHCSQPLFVTGGDDYKVKVWNYQKRRCLFNLLGHLDYIRTVSFHHEYPWIISSSDDQTIRIWNWQSRSCVSVLTGHNHYVMCVKFHPQDDLIVSASLDQTVRVWDFAGLRKKTVYSTTGTTVDTRGFKERGSANLNPDLFGQSDVVVKYVLEGHTRGVNWASFHPSMPLIVSGADDREVKLWRMNDMKAWEVDSMRGHINNVSCVLFHPRKELIITNSEDKSIRIWDMSRKMHPKVLRRENDRYWILACHPKFNILAAGHDSGMFVFKLNRERPPFDVFKDLFYFKDQYIHQHVYSSGQDVPLICPQGQLASGDPGARYLAVNSLNSSELNFLLSSDVDGIAYELYTVSKKGVNMGEANAFRGAGCAIFISKNRFAVLLKCREIIIKNMANEIKVRVSLPVPVVSTLFFAGIGRLILSCPDRFVLFDVQAKKILGELITQNRFPVKHVLWSRDRKYCAFLSKFVIYVTDSKLKELCTINDNSRIKGGAWDIDGLFIYTTTTHIKYCLTTGDSGIIRTLDAPVYITAIKGDTVYCLDRNHDTIALQIDNTEAVFKRALLARRYDDVKRIVKSGKLIGQSIIGYLQTQGYPEVALYFVKDERTRFTLALQCGNIEAALECAQKVNDTKCWHQLGVEALRQGNQQIVELAYQQTKEFERLSFMYAINGSLDKLVKMLDIAKARGDDMSRFYNALLLGDVEERVRVLADTGQTALAFLTAHSHGLVDDAERLEGVLKQNVPDVKMIERAKLLVPPTPIVEGGNWPRLAVAAGYFDGVVAPNDSVEQAERDDDDDNVGDDNANTIEHTVTEDIDLIGWGEEIAVPTKTAGRVDDAGPVGEGWGEDLLDTIPDLPTTTTTGDAVPDDEYFVVPMLGETDQRRWMRTSTQVCDMVAAGSFEIAMQTLNRQIGAINFAPFKQHFIDVFTFTKFRVPSLTDVDGIDTSIPRLSQHTELPAISVSLNGCNTRLEQAQASFVEHKQRARTMKLLREVLFMLPLVPLETKTEAEQCMKILKICREYMMAIRLGQARSDAGDNDQLSCELAALMTKCKLLPTHMILCLYSAIGAAFKIKNLHTAGLFCRRFLELSTRCELPTSLQAAPNKVRMVARKCDSNDVDAIPLAFDISSTFDIDGVNFTALPSRTATVSCPFCQTKFSSSSKNITCPCCTVAKVGADAEGFLGHV